MISQGRVVDNMGQPVPSASVTIVWASRPVPEIAIIADDEGAFRISLPSGDYTLTALGPDGWHGEATVGGNTEVFTIRLNTPPP